MDASLGLKGWIQIAQYRNGQLISKRDIPNATTADLATKVAAGLATGSCEGINYLQLELKNSSSASSGSTAQQPMQSTTDTVVNTGHSLSNTTHASKSVATVTISASHISGGYDRLTDLKLGYDSAGNGTHASFTAYANRVLSGGDIVTVEDGDKIEVTWYVGGSDGTGSQVSEAVAHLIASGSDTNNKRPNKLGYQQGGDQYFIGISGDGATGSDTGGVGGADFKSVTYTTAQFTGGSSETPAKTGATGFFGREAVHYADGTPKAGGSPETFDIVNGTNYKLQGIIQVTWG